MIMNNIKTFENFRNEKLDQGLNEGLFDALKSVWKFFRGVNKILQTNVGNYVKKLDNSKTWADTLTNITNMIITPNTKYFDDSMKNATTISEIRRINYEVHKSTFTELNATYKKWDGKNENSPISPSSIFVGTPFATMYNFTDTEKFVQKLTDSINGLVSNYAKKVGYPMEDVTKSINNYKDLTLDPPKENTNQQTTNQPPPETVPTPTNASYIMSFNNFNKIFEADPAPAGGNPPVEPVGNPAPEGGTNTPPEGGNQGGTIDQLKTENINNFKNNFYGIMQKKLKAFKPTTTPTTTNTPAAQGGVDNIVKSMTGSGDKVDSKKNLIKTITDPKLTADQLGKVRDAIAPILNINKPEETIGKFK